ncbi:hypothetical protein [Flavobacterium sp. 14A]|uniref:hypothetical protein n=1 Tax=Flavobacterium sp. 14A TaxID=2735896 RepID=UPI00156E2EFF|nr:hypothetical protein [Flavobacterium sp. 14A]NRT12143.1 hypothetical protein [Flavobacterium sp. 14A]
MNTITSTTFTATATVGLYKSYSKELISINTFKKALCKAQEEIKKEFNVALSTKMTLCQIIFLGQEEPSVSLDFIQYPKFPKDEVVLQEAIMQLVQLLMESLDQNRIVIVFQNETICLEKSEEIDPKIQL